MTNVGYPYPPNPSVPTEDEEFEFRPGGNGLVGGAVISGARSNSQLSVVTGLAPVNTNVWSADMTFMPRRSGLIDGKDSNGVIYGQITVNVFANANTPTVKIAMRIRNYGTGSYDTLLPLTGAYAISTGANYNTYDIPYLLTTPNFNSVPFNIALGIQSNSNLNSITGTIMESSFIAGKFTPGT